MKQKKKHKFIKDTNYIYNKIHRKGWINKMRFFERNTGITLIALVITIIVLLILAGVALATITGDDGLLAKAKQARQNTLDAQNAENGTLEGYEDVIDYVLGESAGIIVEEKPSDWTNNKVTAITDGEGGVIPLPQGFFYVGGTKSEGIVISDNSIDEGKGMSHEVAKTLQGNQFVWVPVEDDEDFQRYKSYANDGNLQELTNYHEPAQTGFQYSTAQSEYDAMRASVLQYNGFYVGRYEAGVDGEARTSTSEITNEVVIKQGVNVYNYISWGNSLTDPTGGAVEVSKSMYSREKNGVTSTLIYGVQWDAIMSWIEPRYKNQILDDGLYDEGSFVANSSGKGNYEGNVGPTTTGSKAEYAVKNIYDLAGNVWEWTMESYRTTYSILRGGKYNNSGSERPASNRGTDGPYNIFDYSGFRISLYL